MWREIQWPKSLFTRQRQQRCTDKAEGDREVAAWEHWLDHEGREAKLWYPLTGTGPTNDVKIAAAGQALQVNVSSPAGAYDLQPYTLLGQFFTIHGWHNDITDQ